MQPLRLLAIAALLCAACSSGEDRQLSELARHGEQIYQNVCIACHNGDPNRDGSLGPANAGASAELLEAKVVRGVYPPGYTPKRADSHAMPRFEHLADDIPALAAYLDEVETSAPDAR
jgi:mono/diheme cytochrome c family protein